MTLVGQVDIAAVVTSDQLASHIGLISDTSPLIFITIGMFQDLDAFALICFLITNGGGWYQMFALLFP